MLWPLADPPRGHGRSARQRSEPPSALRGSKTKAAGHPYLAPYPFPGFALLLSIQGTLFQVREALVKESTDSRPTHPDQED